VRDTYLKTKGGAWTPVSELPNSALLKGLELLSKPEFGYQPDSPNGGKSKEDFRDRIMIEIRARELGLV
jgi:hypothetical protein